MRAAAVTGAGLVLVFAIFATMAGYGVDRGRYVAANEAILDELSVYPGSRLSSTQSYPYYAGDSGVSPVVGYVTVVLFELPHEAAPENVAAYYERELSGEWQPTAKLTEPPFAAGPILDFERGDARVTVNLESWRGGVLEIAIDHAGA